MSNSWTVCLSLCVSVRFSICCIPFGYTRIEIAWHVNKWPRKITFMSIPWKFIVFHLSSATLRPYFRYIFSVSNVHFDIVGLYDHSTLRYLPNTRFTRANDYFDFNSITLYFLWQYSCIREMFTASGQCTHTHTRVIFVVIDKMCTTWKHFSHDGNDERKG